MVPEKTDGPHPRPTVEELRRDFAERVRTLAAVRTASLVRALATVPRERFVGSGPWKILRPGRFDRGYETTPDDDPRHVYDLVLIALDADRRLNNGEPVSLLHWLDCLDLRSGERFLHVGCGVGYYTAIAAEAVCPGGSVVGVEIDPELAERAARNLRTHANAAVGRADASAYEAAAFDAIFVNAGATEVQAQWFDALRLGGRLLVPLTVADEALDEIGFGHMLLVTKGIDRHAARFVSPVGIFHCAGARTNRGNDVLKQAYARGRQDAVASLRRDRHDPDADCWLHGDEFCLSFRPVADEIR